MSGPAALQKHFRRTLSSYPLPCVCVCMRECLCVCVCVRGALNSFIFVLVVVYLWNGPVLFCPAIIECFITGRAVGSLGDGDTPDGPRACRQEVDTWQADIFERKISFIELGGQACLQTGHNTRMNIACHCKQGTLQTDTGEQGSLLTGHLQDRARGRQGSI